MSHPVVHWEIGARSAAASREFYAKLFGWEILGAGDAGYAQVAPGEEGGMGGGIMQLPPGVPPYVTVYVRVDDLDAALKRAESLGGKTVAPPMPIEGVAEVSGFAMFSDPDGNVIGLLKMAT